MYKEKEIDHLESVSAFYEENNLIDELLVAREMELIRRYVQNTTEALEVGCGNGCSSEYLLKIFEKVEIVEPSKNNINLLRKRIDAPLIIHNTLIEKFNPDRVYANIVFLNVLEHVMDPVQTLRHLSFLLSDRGRVFISVPNYQSLNRRAGFLMGLMDTPDQFAPKDYLVGHRRLYDVGKLRNHCSQAGFEIEYLKGVFLKPLSEKQMIELGPDALNAFFKLGEDIPQYCANLFAVLRKTEKE